MSRRTNLVITRAGSGSLHKNWLGRPQERNFDVLVAAYDEVAMAPDEEGLTHTLIRGPKVAGWNRLFHEQPTLLETYRQIALIDDDIDATASDFSKCFEYGSNLSLSIWQPSLSWVSFFTFGFTLSNPLFRLRYVNYIEMMCPFFNRDALSASLPLFDLRLEVGIDLIWCSLVAERHKRFAVIDDIRVHHTRKVGSMKVANGFVTDKYEDHIYRCLNLFDAKWPSAIAYCGIGADGGQVQSQLMAAIKTLVIAPAVLSPDWRPRIKPILDHIRHQFSRKPQYISNAEGVLKVAGNKLVDTVRS